jgi:hypothetical protein
MYLRRPPTIIRVEAGFGERSFNGGFFFFDPDFFGCFLAMLNPFGAGQPARSATAILPKRAPGRQRPLPEGIVNRHHRTLACSNAATESRISSRVRRGRQPSTARTCVMSGTRRTVSSYPAA